MADTHSVIAWLTLEAKPASWNRNVIGNVRVTRTTRNKPQYLARNEVCVKVTLRIPEAVFTRPPLVVHIDIPESAALSGEVVASVADLSEEVPPLTAADDEAESDAAGGES